MNTFRRFSVVLVTSLLGACDGLGPSCWTALDRLGNDLQYMLDSKPAINTSELVALRRQLAEAVRSCDADEPFYKDLSEDHLGIEAYWTLLDFAMMANDAELTAEMFERQQRELSPEFRRKYLIAGEAYLETAAYLEADEVVRWLLDTGFDPNEVGEADASALHFSGARTDYGLTVTRDLVAAGADIELEVLGETTPLKLALQRGDLRKAQCLVSLGAAIPEAVIVQSEIYLPFVDPQDVDAVAGFLESTDRVIPERIATICTVNP